MSSFSNKPRILRGAFVEYGLSLPPLFVVFQFNPEQLTRNRTLNYSVPSVAQATKGQTISLRDFHKQDKYKDLDKLREAQVVDVGEETIGLEIRFDASDKLDEGDPITEQFGISPQLATLEEMVYPKDEGLRLPVVGTLLGSPEGSSFTCKEKPPLILFLWGRKRVLPVNINSLNITEILYSPDLNPIRATASVNLTVIEGNSGPYKYSKAMKEAMSVLNLANISEIANIVIPG
jgi:hypothetical protein